MKQVLYSTFSLLGNLFTKVKIIGHPDRVEFYAVDDTGTLIFRSTAKGSYPALIGEYGVSNIPLFIGLLKHGPYNEDGSVLTTKRDVNPSTKEETVMGFEFRDVKKRGADFRTMNSALMKTPQEADSIKWSISLEPAASKVSEFDQLSRMMGEIGKRFTIIAKDGEVEIGLGPKSGSTHRASMVFADGIEGTMTEDIQFSSDHFLRALKAFKDSPVKMSATGRGLMEIRTEQENQSHRFFLRASKSK